MEDKKFTLVVAGLGRCGTSLAMQLLDASAYPCHGEFPAYEERDSDTHALIEQNFLQGKAGKAVKIIDPHHGALNFEGCRVVYLERDLKEQARSNIKMARIFVDWTAGGFSRAELRGMSALLKRDNRKCLSMFKMLGVPVLRYRFEDILKDPQSFMYAVCAFTGHNTITTFAKDTVINRSPECYNGFLELDLIEKQTPHRSEKR